MRAFTIAALLGAALAVPTTPKYNIDDYSCKSSKHPNPVVFLHGLLGSAEFGLAGFQSWMQDRGFCTFSLTYGENPLLPGIGGLQAIAKSAPEIEAYIKTVQKKTGASKVDIIGHSEGGFQALYVTKFGAGIKEIVRKLIAIGPPTHGTDFGGLLTELSILRDLPVGVLNLAGCHACKDLVQGGPAVVKLDKGPIAQKGVEYTIIASQEDEIVTPHETSFVREPGVRNMFIQDICPADASEHIQEGFDQNVWRICEAILEGDPNRKVDCSYSGFIPGALIL